jgi:hypothetical protein
VTATLDLAPLATAAADYQRAVARLEDAAGDAEAAWKLLPAALDSPGTQLAVGRFVGPAHQLSSALLLAAASLHTALLASVQPLRRLEAEAAPGDAGLAARVAAEEADCAAAIAAIRGGEAGSVDLPCPAAAPRSSYSVHAATALVPVAPTSGLPGFGSALIDGAGTVAEALGAFGLFGVLGLVLSLGGSTDENAGKPHDQSNRRPVKGVHPVRITPYTPCNPIDNGPGCEMRHLSVEKPGDVPFTGEKVRGDEAPGTMPGTKSDWAMRRTDNDEGWLYQEPGSGKSQRVVEPPHDERYPNGYVQFTNKNGQVIDIHGHTVKPASDAAHIPRNPNGSFPTPTGWTK